MNKYQKEAEERNPGWETLAVVEDGKYIVQSGPKGNVVALRYGEPWQDLTGNKMVYCLAARIQELEQVLGKVHNAMVANDNSPDKAHPWVPGGTDTKKLKAEIETTLGVKND